MDRDLESYADYMGTGVAHHAVANLPKPRAPQIDVEEPKSVDVFASSQPSESSERGDSGPSDYDTCKESMDDEEEEEEDEEMTIQEPKTPKNALKTLQISFETPKNVEKTMEFQSESSFSAQKSPETREKTQNSWVFDLESRRKSMIAESEASELKGPECGSKSPKSWSKSTEKSSKSSENTLFEHKYPEKGSKSIKTSPKSPEIHQKRAYRSLFPRIPPPEIDDVMDSQENMNPLDDDPIEIDEDVQTSGTDSDSEDALVISTMLDEIVEKESDDSQDVFEDDAKEDRPTRDHSYARDAVDENLEEEDDEDSYNRRYGQVQPMDDDDEMMEEGDEDGESQDAVKGDLEIDSSEQKMEMGTPVKATTTTPSKRNETMQHARNDDNAPSPSSHLSAARIPERPASERRRIPPEVEALHRQDIQERLEQFRAHNMYFEPDLRKADPKKHYIYCDIPGLEPKYHPRREDIMNQIWMQTDARDNTNHFYLIQKKLLQRFIGEHQNAVPERNGGYQLFAGLIADMAPARSENASGEFKGLWKYFFLTANKHGQAYVLNQFVRLATLALSAEVVLPQRISLLSREVCSATFSREQCAALVARMFFATGERSFQYLLHCPTDLNVEKLRFLFAYFDWCYTNRLTGCVTFRRVLNAPETLNARIDNAEKYPLPGVCIRDDLYIEETALSTQVDFANASIGGGVLTTGSVQEEIRFLMCPEMMVSMLLVSKPMILTEAFSIVGARVYSSYSGYADKLKWEPLQPHHARQNRDTDEYGRFLVETIAIDAISYRHYGRDPFHLIETQIRHFERELNKATVGFSAQSRAYAAIPIVSGWWGCGIFRGNKQLKFLIQVIAAGVLRRRLVFCPFGDKEMAGQCRSLMARMKEDGITIGELHEMIDRMKHLKYVELDAKTAETFVFERIYEQLNAMKE